MFGMALTIVHAVIMPIVNAGLTKNAGHENAGHEFAIHDKYRMKIYYITEQCPLLLNFKSFVCTASVLTWKT